jgi:hypothetical protein
MKLLLNLSPDKINEIKNFKNIDELLKKFINN